MDSRSTSQYHRATRSSLACLPCRSRHLKCDGKRPCCDRCSETGKQCSYAQSRRGGLDRAALAERRNRLAAAAVNSNPDNVTSWQGAATLRQPQEGTAVYLQVNSRFESCMRDLNSGPGHTNTVPPSNIGNDPLIDSYYKNFHICHPLVIPRNHLTKLYQDPSRQEGFAPLIAVIRFIGNIYKAREWSIPLKTYLEASFSQASALDPIMVQCRLLYSIALFWYEYKTDAKLQMDLATKRAIDLQMFRQEFAAANAAEDLVLRESWRRTWWMLYIVDAYYAGTLGTLDLRIVDIEATAELPCDESDYESGNIPTPRSLQEFNCREFGPKNIRFSSFAYLIGAVQCAAFALTTTSKIPAEECSTHITQAADCSLDGWRLLLPPDHKQVMDVTGKVDELMFQAHLLIHVSTIGLHRPLSNFRFNTAETESSCAREPPLDIPSPDLVNVHTIRVLRAIEAQIRLLALPIQQFHHTPFTTCMVSKGTLALLSACNAFLKGRDLAIARDQIRMTLGCLKALGEVWPRIARNVQEIQKIAQRVLALGYVANSHSTPGSSDIPVSGAEGPSLASNASDILTNDIDMIASLGAINDLCGWYNVGGPGNLP
ncbi:hypothetical protein ASPBRDRAFT_138635 [Aspergillus brasiliensis CBS 101740]|uniref:Zn(2)-C6 fungal-type domain-containing protein n=1 Tax=Aspergillus brasiliensis (strain CBS 101740 / IMI 381727 / IBT 21946) TaxID=767769 RepID=A0A1L9U365_ASPBC|nr:hypothetical protein ASPBRDRAFT_138635 [Aspergillus brasiliensis CBS 101740]